VVKEYAAGWIGDAHLAAGVTAIRSETEVKNQDFHTGTCTCGQAVDRCVGVVRQQAIVRGQCGSF